jgi:tetratricopeptide (TPR) repeat protein
MKTTPRVLLGVVALLCAVALIDWKTANNLGALSLKSCQDSEGSWRGLTCEMAVVLSRDKYVALKASAEYQLDEENFSEALNRYTTAEPLGRNDADLYFRRGDAFSGLERPDDAIRDYNRAIAIDPTQAGHFNNRGNVYFNLLKQMQAAVSDYKKANQLDPASPIPLANLGHVFYELEDFPAALKQFTAALERERDADLYEYRAEILHRLGRNRDAIDDISEAIKLRPSVAKLYSDRGFYLCAIGRSREALKDHDYAITLEPKNSIYFHERSVCLNRIGDRQAALADISKAITLNDKDPLSFFQRAYILSDLKRYADAIEDWARVIKLDPKDSSAYFNRARDRYFLDDLKGAKEDFDVAARITPNNPGFYAARRIVLEELGDSVGAASDTKKALELYSKEIKNRPSALQLYLQRGELLNAANFREKAEADFKKALQIDPENIEARKAWGSFLIDGERYQEAVDTYTAVITRGERDAEIFNNRGLASFYLKQYEAAISNFSEAIRLDPSDPLPFVNRAETFEKQDRISRAIVDMNSAIRLDTKDVEKYRYRGDLWRAGGNSEKAVSDYTEAIARDKKNVRSYFERGVTFIELGRLAEAESDLRLVLSLDSQHDNAREQLRIIESKRSSQQTSRDDSGAQGARQSRVALVIGNGRYLYAPQLKNTVSDAILISQQLSKVGFDVSTVVDASKREMTAALSEFKNKAKRADWALIYFAGHGVEIQGVNFMIPVDGNIAQEQSAARETVNLQSFIDSVETARLLRMVILDACRDDPFSRPSTTRGINRSLVRERLRDSASSSSVNSSLRIDERNKGGLARVEPDPGTLVVFAAKSGQVALDGSGKNSPFATALVKRIRETPPREVRRIFDFVREDVSMATKGIQQPFAYGSLAAAEDFYFTRAQ